MTNTAQMTPPTTAGHVTVIVPGPAESIQVAADVEMRKAARRAWRRLGTKEAAIAWMSRRYGAFQVASRMHVIF